MVHSLTYLNDSDEEPRGLVFFEKSYAVKSYEVDHLENCSVGFIPVSSSMQWA